MIPLQIRASSTDRAALCAQAVVPTAVPFDPVSPESRLGEAFHFGIARSIRGEFLRVADVARQFGVDQGELEFLATAAWRCWRPSLESGRQGLSDQFPNPLVERQMSWTDPHGRILQGRADLLSPIWDQILEDPVAVHVGDWKTGAVESKHENQLKAYCWLALQEFPTAARAKAIVIRVRQEQYEWVWYTREQLHEWWYEFAESLEQQPVAYNPGGHCGFCPRALECPGRAALWQQTSFAFLFASPEVLVRVLRMRPKEQNEWVRVFVENCKPFLGNLDDRGAFVGELWRRLKLMERITDQLRELVRSELEIHGGSLDTRDGSSLVKTQVQRQAILSEPAWPVLLEMFTEDEIRSATTLSKQKLIEVIKKKVPPGQIKSAIDYMMGGLESAGAIRADVTERLELKKNGQPALEPEHEPS